MKKIIILTIFIIFCCISMLPAQQIPGIVEKAVNDLTSGFNAPLPLILNPVTIVGTNSPSEVSRLLDNLISRNARIQVVQPVLSISTVQTGIISGTFTPKADVVDVSLIRSEKGVKGSPVQFSIPVAEFQHLGISIEPENMNALLERERLFSGLSLPVEQPVRIQALFNSSTMTYLHRDFLDITVMADRDCYFKVILIDVNNQEQVIFPGERDDNFLKANTAKKVFGDDSGIMLYGPYGAETILIIASPNQFPNIRQDYLSPPHPSTAASIRDAVSGNGVTRYDINILKPHDEYYMALPSDLSEIIQTLKEEVNSQGGIYSISRNERNGAYYFPNIIRYSYRVGPSNNLDSVEVAVYYQDVWNGDFNRTTRGGKGFPFSIDMPRNLSLAIIEFEKKIKSSGDGDFVGDTRKGNFYAKNMAGFIKGEYNVNTVTNKIDINITDRSSPLPTENQIKAEIKKFLSGL
jgi:hypothetical protein